MPTHTEDSCHFFLVTAPGFEREATDELKSWCPEIDGKVEHGGINVECSLKLGYGLNRVLKVPTRILVRLADYGCRDFPKLYKKMAAFAWDQWIPDSCEIEFVASATNSRLRIKKRIEETCADGRRAYLNKKGVKTSVGASVRVLVRFDNDVCWVSLDTSGEILHKRGLRPLSALAPLRESTAAGLLRYLESFGKACEAVELVDPMTGGGTFLLEAAGQLSVVNSRGFAFENLVVNESLSFTDRPSRYVKLIGFESNHAVLEAARDNLSSIEQLQLVEADFFETAPLPAKSDQRWLIANPPYGERIRIDGPLNSYYEKLFSQAERVAKPDRSLFVLPDKVKQNNLRIPPEWKLIGSKPFSNGGLNVTAVVYGRF